MFRSAMMTLAVVLLTAGQALGHEEAAPPPKQEAPAVPIKLVQTKRGWTMTDSRGMTLYYYDRDDAGNKSTCDGKCAERWIPVAAADNATAKGDFTVIIRSDNSKMWAYRNRPLYTSPADKAPGDANGIDPANLWHVARPAL